MTDTLPASSSVPDALQALLEWYAGAGVDAVWRMLPYDRFAASAAERERRAARPRASAPASRPAPARLAPTAPQAVSSPSALAVPSADAVMAARTGRRAFGRDA